VVAVSFAILAAHQLGPSVAGLVLIDSASYRQRLPFYVGGLRLPVIGWLTFRLSPAYRSRFVFERLMFDKTRITEERVQRYAVSLGQPGTEYSATCIAKQILPRHFEEATRIIQTIAVPTLILWGGRDPAVPVAFAHRLHADIRGSSLTVFPKAGHIPHEECPDEVLAALLPFLRGLRC
jgi:pimeloyl-ACP methyl ester carboxylesterase